MAQIPVETPAGAQAKVDAHSTAADAHAGSATTGDVSAAMGAHETATDPHTGYLTQTEGDGRYVQPVALGDYATDAELAAGLSGRQPLDSDLTALAGLTPANDDLPQHKGGVWTSRTPAQVKADMALTKDDVGLDQVSNLAPDALPVSTAQASYATSRAVALAIVLGG